MISAAKLATYPETQLCGISRVDGTAHFYRMVRQMLQRPGDSNIYDVGCGRGAWCTSANWGLRDMTSYGRVIGLDVDPLAANNPMIHHFRSISLDGLWIAPDDDCDFALSDYVLEHVDNPDVWFAELARVLKPGAAFAIRTPNRWFYICVIARLLHWLPRRWRNKLIPRDEQDIFPTVYRANTKRKLRALLKRHGLEGVVYSIEAEPCYLERWPRLYRLMSVVHRWIPSALQSTLIVVGRKS